MSYLQDFDFSQFILPSGNLCSFNFNHKNRVNIGRGLMYTVVPVCMGVVTKYYYLLCMLQFNIVIPKSIDFDMSRTRITFI